MPHCCWGGEDKHFSFPRWLIGTTGQVKLLILYDGTRNCTTPSSPPPPPIVHHPHHNVPLSCFLVSNIRLLNPKKQKNVRARTAKDDLWWLKGAELRESGSC